MTTIVAPSSFSTVIAENKNTMAKIEEFRNEKLGTGKRNLIFAGMFVGGLFLTGLFALQIISGLFALICTVGTGVGAWYGIKYLKAMDPVIRQKWKNKALDMMVKEARENAIRQLDNHVLENTERLAKARNSRDKMGGLVEKLKAKLAQTDPSASTYERKKQMLDRVENAYEQIKTCLEKAARANQEFEQKVRDYKELDAFNQMANSAMSIFDEVGGTNLREMLSLEAFESIEDSFHTSLIAIENNAADMTLDSEAEAAYA